MESLMEVAVVGAAGRMGQAVLRALTPEEGFRIVLAVDRQAVGQTGRDLIGPAGPDVVIESDLLAGLERTRPSALIDFSHHSGALANALIAIRAGVSPVIGATGLSGEDLAEIDQVAQETGTPAMYIPNFAIGAVLMMRFAALAARWMPDAEIIELHHDRKEDAPSGTAIRTADLIADARHGEPVAKPAALIKVEGARGGLYRDTPIHSVRLPGLVAHQEVLFGGPGEHLSIRHDSLDRVSFMPGVRLALRKVRERTGLTVGLEALLFE